MSTRGMILNAVRIVSVIPEKTIPAMFSPQKTVRSVISMSSTGDRSKKLMYCPIPAAMVEIPKTEDMV